MSHITAQLIRSFKVNFIKNYKHPHKHSISAGVIKIIAFKTTQKVAITAHDC
jgi:hypothetical protein